MALKWKWGGGEIETILQKIFVSLFPLMLGDIKKVWGFSSDG